MEYAELHAHSNFSFLDGASHPEELVDEAVRLGLYGLALTDHDGFYGAVRFSEAAREVGLPTIFGAELSFGLTRRQSGLPDPEGHHLVVLARSPDGYSRLSRVISEAQLAGGEKGKPIYSMTALADVHQGQFLVLTGCRKGLVPSALVQEGPKSAARALRGLVEMFGSEHVAVELWDHGSPLDSVRNDALANLAVTHGVDFVATTNAHYARPEAQRLFSILAAIRARKSLDELDGWLPASTGRHLRSGEEQARRFSRYPGAVERTVEIAQAISFDLQVVAPGLPPFPTSEGQTEMEYLRRLTEQAATMRYGSRRNERVAGAWKQIDHELEVIEKLNFPGYFLIVWDIVQFCRTNHIFCQGRGSAANSAVCFALGITNADAVSLGLLFERFLSPARDGPPDIDIDIESGRREEVIQYVYERYGRHHAAQVANVISYRPRSAIRDIAKALGHAPGTADAWTKGIERSRGVGTLGEEFDHLGRVVHDIPSPVLEFAEKVERFPRHLGIHSGGMVLCDRPIIEVCPVEWATMPGRTVLQWDKDDCAAAGLVKFDLLGLGMLEALHRCLDFIALHHDEQIDLSSIPQETEVYDMLCQADTVGVFQVESRAQMGTLPRLKPREFYDLVVEVALIRPGPIQGGSVHPYLRRRNGEEEITYPHPILERSLGKTLGVPLFQEQLMQIAIDAAGFSPSEADRLRQAMGNKRSAEKMSRLKDRFYAGMAEKGICGETADEIFSKMAAFANFGFPESHAVSFAYLVYASAYLKLHYPAAFCAALLNSQPMGFWAPRTLVADAQRHGVVVLRADVNHSGVDSSLEAVEGGGPGPALRLGLSSIRSIGKASAERIASAAPFRDLEDLARRAALDRTQLEALTIAGATLSLDSSGRRSALWAVGAYADQGGIDRLEGIVVGVEAPSLPEMSEAEEVIADLWATGISIDASLTSLVRPDLAARGVKTAEQLRSVMNGSRVLVGGCVTHRQRPETARGVTFLSLEDETGLINIVVSVGCWKRYRTVAQRASAMIVRGRVERTDGVINIVADKLEELNLPARTRSRDFS